MATRAREVLDSGLARGRRQQRVLDSFMLPLPWIASRSQVNGKVAPVVKMKDYVGELQYVAFSLLKGASATVQVRIIGPPSPGHAGPDHDGSTTSNGSTSSGTSGPAAAGYTLKPPYRAPATTWSPGTKSITFTLALADYLILQLDDGRALVILADNAPEKAPRRGDPGVLSVADLGILPSASPYAYQGDAIQKAIDTVLAPNNTCAPSNLPSCASWPCALAMRTSAPPIVLAFPVSSRHLQYCV